MRRRLTLTVGWAGDAAGALALAGLTLTHINKLGTPQENAGVYLYQPVHGLGYDEIFWDRNYSSLQTLPHPGPILF
jgi:hypothetical protein